MKQLLPRRESNDTSLSDLTIDGTQIAGFTSTKDTYNITLPFGTTSFVLGATPNDTNASILDRANKLGTMTLTGNTESGPCFDPPSSHLSVQRFPSVMVSPAHCPDSIFS